MENPNNDTSKKIKDRVKEVDNIIEEKGVDISELETHELKLFKDIANTLAQVLGQPEVLEMFNRISNKIGGSDISEELKAIISTTVVYSTYFAIASQNREIGELLEYNFKEIDKILGIMKSDIAVLQLKMGDIERKEELGKYKSMNS